MQYYLLKNSQPVKKGVAASKKSQGEKVALGSFILSE